MAFFCQYRMLLLLSDMKKILTLVFIAIVFYAKAQNFPDFIRIKSERSSVKIKVDSADSKMLYHIRQDSPFIGNSLP